MLDLIFK